MLKYLVFLLLIFSCTRNNEPLIPPDDRNQITIFDYQYAAFKYFFVDSFYMDYYVKGFSQNLEAFNVSSEHVIEKLEVFVGTEYLDADEIPGVASLNPSQFDSINQQQFDQLSTINGKLEKRNFRLLVEGNDYFFTDLGRILGFFYLNEQVDSFRTIAIAYQTRSQKVGTFVSDFAKDPKNNVLNLRLIKCRNLGPENKSLWPLMMKNVYEIEDSTLTNLIDKKITIEYNQNGVWTAIQPDPPKKPFTYLLGLDIKNNLTGELSETGDGLLDFNFLVEFLQQGKLIFPTLQPFDPPPNSRFQLSSKNRANIYSPTPWTLNNLKNNSRFRIRIEH